MVVMEKLWRDPRTGILTLRKRIPLRLKAASGLKGDTVKISTGTADKNAALRQLPRILAEWQTRVAEWERRANVVTLTPTYAREIAAGWAAWVSQDLTRLHRVLSDRGLFATGVERKLLGAMGKFFGGAEMVNDTREAEAMRDCISDACRLAAVSVPPETFDLLALAMRPVVAAAFRQAALRDEGATGEGKRWAPLDHERTMLPKVHLAALTLPGGLGLDELFTEWATVAVSKPRTVGDARYGWDMLRTFLEHDDASRVTREDVRRWREATKAAGITNNTWNNRLSMVRQVFALAVADGRLKDNPADNGLRLRKNKSEERFPYTDSEAACILIAARKETRPARRWAHWIMAFSGMRVAEVLQLTTDDVRCVDGIWHLAVHEDDPGKSVKTGIRRNVPLHPRVIAEGFLAYVETLPPLSPVFPDKKPDKFGNRGGRGWNVVGRWVRTTVGITDRKKAPDHSWRHRIEDELRAAEVPEDARDAITGRERKTTGRFYGVRGEALARLARELGKVRSPPGLG